MISESSLNNPFTIAYDAIFKLVAESDQIARLVTPSNRIGLGDLDKTDPIKEEALSSDYPEIILVSDSADSNIHASNTSFSVVREYAWIINAADYRLALDLLSVEWAVLTAMLPANEVLINLDWNSEKFINEVNLMSLRESDQEALRTRGLRGWAAIWSCRVAMRFSRDGLYT